MRMPMSHTKHILALAFPTARDGAVSPIGYKDNVSELVKFIQNAYIRMHGYNEYTAKIFVHVILINENRTVNYR